MPTLRILARLKQLDCREKGPMSIWNGFGFLEIGRESYMLILIAVIFQQSILEAPLLDLKKKILRNRRNLR